MINFNSTNNNNEDTDDESMKLVKELIRKQPPRKASTEILRHYLPQEDRRNRNK